MFKRLLFPFLDESLIGFANFEKLLIKEQYLNPTFPTVKLAFALTASNSLNSLSSSSGISLSNQRTCLSSYSTT